MANLRQFYFDQLVQALELRAGFEGLEQADHNLLVDLGLVGIASGAGVTQHSPTPDVSVDVAIGTAYDQQGRRMRVPSLQVVPLTVDSNSVSTAVANPGQSKILGLFLRFKRNESDPRTDGNGDPVNFVQDEGFEFIVVQGAEAGSPAPPTLLTDGLLLADITRTFGQTQIVTANISTARRQETISLTASSLTVNAGTAEGAMQAILTHLANHIDGVANKHPASAIDYAGSGAFADGVSIAAGTMEAALDSAVSLLASTAGSGANKIGINALTTWLGGRTNPPNVLRHAVDKIITDLSAATGGDDGAERIGAAAGVNLTAGSVRSQLDELDAEKGGLALLNTWTGDQIFEQTITLSEALRFAADNDRSGTPGHISFQSRSGTGANEGFDLEVHAQDGQAQSGGSNNTHGGGFRMRVGSPGTGGSGTAGRTRGHVIEHGNPAITSPRHYTLLGYPRQSILANSTSQVLATIDPLEELDSSSNVFHVTAIVTAGQASGATAASTEIKATLQMSSGTLSMVGSPTIIHNQDNFVGASYVASIQCISNRILVQMNAPAVNVLASCVVEITV